MTSHAHTLLLLLLLSPGKVRASQWRDVLFDHNLFEARPRNFEFL